MLKSPDLVWDNPTHFLHVTESRFDFRKNPVRNLLVVASSFRPSRKTPGHLRWASAHIRNGSVSDFYIRSVFTHFVPPTIRTGGSPRYLESIYAILNFVRLFQVFKERMNPSKYSLRSTVNPAAFAWVLCKACESKIKLDPVFQERFRPIAHHFLARSDRSFDTDRLLSGTTRSSSIPGFFKSLASLERTKRIVETEKIHRWLCERYAI